MAKFAWALNEIHIKNNPYLSHLNIFQSFLTTRVLATGRARQSYLNIIVFFNVYSSRSFFQNAGTASDRFCRKVGCNYETLYMENILKRSAPVYFEKPDGCPVEWYHGKSRPRLLDRRRAEETVPSVGVVCGA